jgi:cytochrome b pre-mRNA-processing protein 3
VIFGLFRKDVRRTTVAALYARIATTSREQGLYLDLGIPDTLEGRFEALSLHMVLVLRALRQLPAPADDVARDLTDALFRDLDATLREMGVGDTTVPKRMKKLAEAFYGRARAYDGPLEAGDESALAAALGRNVQGVEAGYEASAIPLARYALAADRSLKTSNLDAILSAGPNVPRPGSFAGEGMP